MIERSGDNASLEIRRIVGYSSNLPVTENVLGGNRRVSISPRSVRRFRLMEEDCIQLEFSLETAVHIAIGDYVIDPLFGGKFFVTEETMPKYNASTGGYDYSLRLDAEYMLWKNWIHCLVVEVGGTTQRMESEWGLTDRLQVHAQQIADEVNLLIGETILQPTVAGGLSRSDGYCVQVTADKASDIHFISYNGKNIIDSLNLLAETWECEWWVTTGTTCVVNQTRYNKIIHFGKCENSGTVYDFRLGQNVESMDISRDQQTYATRLFVYGGTQNIPEDYDRKLEFEVTSITEDGFLDESKTLNLDMIDSDAIAPNIYSFWFEDANYPSPNAPNSSNVAMYELESNQHTLLGTNTLQGTLESFLTMEADDWAALDIPEVSATAAMIYGQSNVNVPITVDVRKIGAGKWMATADLESNFPFGNNEVSVRFKIVWSVKFDQWSVHTNDSIGISNRGVVQAFNPNDLKKLVTVVYNGTEYNAKFFNINKRIQFIDNAQSQQVVSAPDGWAVGKIYTLQPLTLKVPLSWYTLIYETGTMSKVGEKRLHLPLDGYPNRYLPAEDPVDNSQLVEIAVIFEEIFPKLKLRIKADSITSETKRQKQEFADGSVKWEDWTQYSFMLEYCTDEAHEDDDEYWEDFRFREDYMLDSSKLQAEFTAPAAMQENGFMLAGMTFDVSFRGVNETTFTVIRNEEYGAKLPNEYLYPQDHDTLFLTGWNPKAMNELGLVAIAENELAEQGNAYKQAILDGQFTFTCKMMSGWFFDLYGNGRFITADGKNFLVKTRPYSAQATDQFVVGNGSENYLLLSAGDRVKVYHDALDEDSNHERCKTSRIIGFEYKLDKPYDTPTYTVGETEAFSRIKQLEKKITKLS